MAICRPYAPLNLFYSTLSNKYMESKLGSVVKNIYTLCTCSNVHVHVHTVYMYKITVN